MNPVVQLREEISIELEAITQVVRELVFLNQDLGKQAPTIREKTAAAAFLAQFYNGIENILKRICISYEVRLPEGDNWHVALFKMFSSPSQSPLPPYLTTIWPKYWLHTDDFGTLYSTAMAFNLNGTKWFTASKKLSRSLQKSN